MNDKDKSVTKNGKVNEKLYDQISKIYTQNLSKSYSDNVIKN